MHLIHRRSWRDFFRSESAKRQAQFSQALAIARDIVQENPAALVDLVRLIGKRIQTIFMSEVLFYEDTNRVIPTLEPELVLFDRHKPLTHDGRNFWDLIQEHSVSKTIYLNRDLVLPWPWSRSRIVGSLCDIGTGKPLGTWKQDWNHDIRYWVPLGIAWVYGGNHSITSGIVQGEGSITVEEVYDISAVYQHVRCDGRYFIRTHDNERIARVESVEFASIFEIGRIMVDNGISA